jgi:hypothetical protein
VEAPGGLPEVLDDVDEVHDDRNGHLPGFGFGVDPVDLVGVAVDQGDPGTPPPGVAAVGLGETGRDHRRGVIGHGGVQPLARGAWNRWLGRVGGLLGQDVGDGARGRGDVEDRSDLTHPLAVPFLALGSAAGQFLPDRGLGGARA